MNTIQYDSNEKIIITRKYYLYIFMWALSIPIITGFLLVSLITFSNFEVNAWIVVILNYSLLAVYAIRSNKTSKDFATMTGWTRHVGTELGSLLAIVMVIAIWGIAN